MSDGMFQDDSEQSTGAGSSDRPHSDLFPDQGRTEVTDSAQESLASALKLTFRVVQMVMILLVVAFLVSGFQTVGETERGVKLTFGKVTRRDLQPGVQWSWPFPIGEMVKVRTGQETLDLGDFFMPNLFPSQRSKPWSEVNQRKVKLTPGTDGSLITADGALAHLECSVRYHREDPVANAMHVYTADESGIVRAAVERGIVSTVAEMSIDQLLRQGGSGASEMGVRGSRIKQIAQETLDAINSGIRIDSINVRDPRPPLAVFIEFDAVSKAEAESAKQRENADRAYRLTLNDVAGEAYEILLDRLDAYELATDLNRNDDAEAILTQINALLEGEPVEIDGKIYEKSVAGEVTLILNDARQYRTDIVAQARSKVDIFHAKLTQFRKEPSVLITADLTRAYRAFLDNGQYETILLPPGASGDIVLAPDPDIPRQIETERNTKQAKETIQGRIDFLQNRARLRTERANREKKQKSGG